MDLNQVPSDMVNETKFEEKKKGGNFMELGRSKMMSVEVEENKLSLELEIQKKDKGLEVIKDKIRVLEGEKLQIEEEIKGLKKKKEILQGAEGGDRMGGELLLDDWDTEIEGVSKWMIENKVLECEKNYALKEVEVWKQKCKELESRLVELDAKLKCQGKDGNSIGIKRVNSKDDDDVGASRQFSTPSCLPGAIYRTMPMEGKYDANISSFSGNFVACTGTPDKQYVPTVDNQTNKVHAKRRLRYQDERCCDEKIAPLTPAGAKPSAAAVIDIIDSDNESDVHVRHRSNSQGEETCWMMSESGDESDRITDGESGKGITAFMMTQRRKRMRDPMVVTSDDESEDRDWKCSKRTLKLDNIDNEGEDYDNNFTPVRQVLDVVSNENQSDDDDIPISQLKRKRSQGSGQPSSTLNPTRARRRLVKYGQVEQDDGDGAEPMQNHPDTLTTEDVAEDESSENESESSGSFIVDDDVSDDFCGGESYEPEDSSDSDLDYKNIISKFHSRARDHNSKWIQEGDMLSDFGKNAVLCMRAVCALYLEQTNEEKACKASLVYNGRSFSKLDAASGTELGEFLTEGNPEGNLVKSVKELKRHDPDGLVKCQKLAKHYSKQVFNMYQNGDYNFFPDSTCSASADV